MYIGNVWAVVAAAAINMVVGAIWYSPVLYAKQWMKEVGRKTEDMSGGSTGYVMTAIFSLVTASVLSALVNALDYQSFWEGAYLGFLAWLAFVVATHAANYIFEGRSRTLFAINVGYPLVSLVLMGGLIAVWR